MSLLSSQGFLEAGLAGPLRRVMLADCGHSPHKDRPAATLEAMVSFLSGLN